MNVNVENFLRSRFEKIKLIKQSEKGEIWIVTDSSGKFFIWKKLLKIGLAYKILKENPHRIFPKIIYCTEDEKSTLIIEEFIQGESLFEKIRQKNYLNENEAKNFLLQICDGLEFLHGKNIIHRDIKPEHLIIQGNVIKLIDFDSVHIYKEGQVEDTEKLGTKGYAPPEQYGFSQSDARNDIYALGITFQKVLEKNYHGYLKEILLKCTEKNPNERYQSADELRDAILNYRPSKKFVFSKKILLMILILISATIYPKFLNEKMPVIEKNSSEEKIVEHKKNEIQSKPQEKVEKKEFPEIKIPIDETTSTTSENFQKLPSQSNFELPEIPSTSVEIESPKNETYQEITGDFVKVKYYLNGQRMNEWTDNLDYDVTNAGTIQYINKNIWENWRLEANNLIMPNNYFQISVLVKNYSQNIFNNSQLEIIYNDGERKTLNGKSLKPNEETIFEVPLNRIQIHDSNLGFSDVKYIIKLNFWGDGAEIRGTSSEYEFIFLKGD